MGRRKKMGRKLEHLGLPPEIIYDILSNLPVKSLVRFRCVSKSFNSLISDSSFQHEHYCRCLQKDPVILFATAYPDSVIHDTHPDALDLFICDTNCQTPITNFTIQFPVPPSSSLNDCVGFGYAPSTNQFKVVRFFFRDLFSGTKNCCEIFTLGTSQWREARCPPPDSSSKYSLHAPFLHGAIHFLSDSEGLSADDAIYALDIESEQYTKIPLPKDYYVTGESMLPILPGGWNCQCLNEFRGSLCLTSNFETSIQLWFLKDYDRGKWVKDHVIDLLPFCSEFLWGQPLAIIGDGRILLNFPGHRK